MAVAERFIYTDQTGAAIDWTATEEAISALVPPQRSHRLGFGGLQITRICPAKWLAEMRDHFPEIVGISDTDPIELVLTLDGAELGRWEGLPREQVAALIALLRAQDLPVVEAETE